MKQIIKIIFILILGNCQSLVSQNLEIYQVKYPYPNHYVENKPNCYYCFKPTIEQLFDKPIITEKDIVSFNWETQTIKLTEEAQKKIVDLEIPLQGLAMAITVNKEVVYGFWFWNVLSSFGCDYVYTFPRMGFKITFHKPFNGGISEDPRFDDKLKTYIENSNINKD
jgi:hypothetical protein